MKLKDKVAVITGAASGIGRATAELFAREGARIVVADINPEPAQEVIQGIKKAGGDATFVKVNVSRSDENKLMVDTAMDTYGRLDILFANAGVAGIKTTDFTEDEWHRVIDVNLTGPFLGCMHAVPLMRKQGGGNIIITSSVAGLRASGSVPYNVSKAGVIMMARAMSKNVAKDNIRINCICPGSVDTPLTEAFMGYPKTEAERQTKQTARIARIPIGRAADPMDMARIALFLASDDASYVTGTAILADGGQIA